MSRQDAFERALVLLHRAALGDAEWPDAAGMIDEISQTRGTALVSVHGNSQPEADFFFLRLCMAGRRREDLEREYFQEHWLKDESIPRIGRQPDGQLVHTGDLYTAQEKKTSTAYNEARRDTRMQNGLNVRLDGPHGSHIVWSLADSVAPGGGWGTDQIKAVQHFLPHVRHFVRVRQVLSEAGALGSSLVGMLDNSSFGIVQLDRQGRIVVTNDRARQLLKQSDGLMDLGGFLRARAVADNDVLQQLLAQALHPTGVGMSAGSMTVQRSFARSRLAIHVNPVPGFERPSALQRVAALVLVIDPETQVTIDPRVVSEALGLTRAESVLAVMLASGHSVSRIAALTDRSESTVRWHLKRVFRKQQVTRQADLVRRVLALNGFPKPPS